MLRFLQERSCNDDYVPLLRITRSTCKPNCLEQASYIPTENTNYNPYPDANIYFKEKTNILSWEADPRLEAIDARLEHICAEEEARMNGAEDDIIRQDFLDDIIRQDILDDIIRQDFIDDIIRQEEFEMDEDRLNNRFKRLSILSLTPVNVFKRTPLLDDETIDENEYFEQHEYKSNIYEQY
jgi:hypothetical protein